MSGVAIVAEDPHEGPVLRVGAAALPILSVLQALERGGIGLQSTAVADVLLRLHAQVDGGKVAQAVVQRTQQVTPATIDESFPQPVEGDGVVHFKRAHGRAPEGLQVCATAQKPAQVIG